MPPRKSKKPKTPEQLNDSVLELINEYNKAYDYFKKHPRDKEQEAPFDKKFRNKALDLSNKINNLGKDNIPDYLAIRKHELDDIRKHGVPIFIIQRKIALAVEDGKIPNNDEAITEAYEKEIKAYNKGMRKNKKTYEENKLNPPKNDLAYLLNHKYDFSDDFITDEPTGQTEGITADKHIEAITMPRHPELDVRSDDDEDATKYAEAARLYKEDEEDVSDVYWYGSEGPPKVVEMGPDGPVETAHEEEDKYESVASPSGPDVVAESSVMPVDDKGGEVVISGKDAVKKAENIITDFMDKNKPMIESLADLSQLIPAMDDATYKMMEHTLSETLKDAKDDSGEKLFGDAGAVINFLRRLRDKNKKKYKLPVNLENAVKREQNLTSKQLNPLFKRSILRNVIAKHFYNE